MGEKGRNNRPLDGVRVERERERERERDIWGEGDGGKSERDGRDKREARGGSL